MSDTEILSDDDVAVVVDQIIDLDKIENAKSNKKKSKHIETIVIDDERFSQSNNNITIVGNDLTLDINSVYKENILLAEFIEKCINLENTGGMMRIINRTLLRVYKEANKDYKNSPDFEKVLQRQISLIEIEPHRKYSHMKNLIEALKSGGVKKRVQLTTLATNLKNKNKRCADFGERKVKRSKRDVIIDLDSEPNDILPVINLDEDPNDVIVLDEPDRTRIDEEKENKRNTAVNHEDFNKIDDHDHENNSEENSYLIPQKEKNNRTKHKTMIMEPVQRHPNDVILLDEPAKPINDEEKDNMQIRSENHRDLNEINANHHENEYEHRNSQNDSEENCYLTPQIEVVVSNNLTEQQSKATEPFKRNMDCNGHIDGPIDVDKLAEEEEHKHIQREIKKIENQIEKCKQIIQMLDEAEVTNDNLTSPYIISEKVKAKIVSLYKTLCELTGSESVKKRTVRLQVQDGHPAGPVRRLEEFINSNIGEDGDPQFPDFRDVTMCVLEANEADGLGWSKGQILKEAGALFTQCGRALQKRRQKREWRDLLATVKTETLEYDPADEDPILQAKLEQNRRIALCKENELLDRFSKMQDIPTQAKLNKINQQTVTQNGIRIMGSCDNINVQNKANMEVPIVNNNNFNTQNSLIIIKTEVSVEFENPHNVENQTPDIVENQTPDNIENQAPTNVKNETSDNIENQTPDNVEIEESKESVHLDARNSNYIPCSQRLQIEGDNPIENDITEANVKVKTETDMEVRSNTKFNDNENYSSCDIAASSKNNIYNVDSDGSTDSNLTVNRNEDNSQEDISKNHNEPDLKNGAGDSLVNEETSSHDKVKIKKEPVDVAALLDSLGDNFSADIFDIEDPFLVIEISDSSDDED